MASRTAEQRAAQQKPRPGRAAGAGILVGIVASVAMAMFAMIAGATYQGSGFYTPMYHIASTFIGPQTMERSMDAATGGNLFLFQPGPALLGLGIHMAVGAFFGLIFGLVAAWTRLRGPEAVAGGIAYGLIVLAFMSFVGLPLVALVLGAGEPISQMPSMVGWGTWIIEHSIFGLVLGVWPLVRSRDVVAEAVPEEISRRRAA